MEWNEIKNLREENKNNPNYPHVFWKNDTQLYVKIGDVEKIITVEEAKKMFGDNILFMNELNFLLDAQTNKLQEKKNAAEIIDFKLENLLVLPENISDTRIPVSIVNDLIKEENEDKLVYESQDEYEIYETKITSEMSMSDIARVMSEGNPGAMMIITKMLEDARSRMDILLLDSLNIRGGKLYNLYNDCCKRDDDNFKITLMMLRSNVFSIKQIHDNLSLITAIPFIDDEVRVTGFDAMDYVNLLNNDEEKWQEFCLKNKDIFEQKLSEVMSDDVQPGR